MNKLIFQNICNFYEKYNKSEEFIGELYVKLLQKLFYCKNSNIFEQILYEIIDIRKKMNKDDSFWRTQISYYFWHSLVGWIDLFYIVYIKNKLLLPILKKNCIYYYSSDILATPPIYKSLIERDTKATTFLLNNGHDIINESGFVYFNRNIHDYETRIDIIDQLILQKNNTSIRCIYENVSIEHIIKKNNNSLPNMGILLFIYDHILPY